MPQSDWLVGRDRHTEAAERIYAFTIEALATRANCSPATIYRHAGGKAAIRDAVIAIQATRIVGTVRDAIKDLTGPDRVVTASILALERLHSDPLAQLMQSTHSVPGSDWLTNSPTVKALPPKCSALTIRTHWPRNGSS
jgi:AcrR family transcriptional regulator